MEQELKQKQIEDLTALIDSFNIRTIKQAQYVAEYIVDKLNYRKIPENAVVLTREAYNRLFTKARQSEIKTIDLESIVNARKETAEKFAERVKMAFYYEFDELIPSIMSDKIDEICKEITGEN